jgi:phosphopantothenoylcysteine decarboxylase/phosphopantothenate--cysteine ligase
VLKGKNIVLAITGSIAAYKSAILVRLLKKEGAAVKVVLSKGALDFVTPMTLSTLSGNPVFSDFTEDPDSGTWTNHVELGLWGDLFILAPCTANTLAKICNGQSDNFLTTVYMSAKCPVLLAPAMDLDMYAHPATQGNIDLLRDRGHTIAEPGNGELASGLLGKGRMAEPENILQQAIDILHPVQKLKGKTVLISAGPTHEAIDPVRFIGNRSSGKMGLALVQAFLDQGAKVNLVAGPGVPKCPDSVNRTDVSSAQEMYDACLSLYPSSNIAVMSAAVADYRPAVSADQKIKKSSDTLSLELVKNPDILFALGQNKSSNNQFLVGFALETNNELEHAKDKLLRKNLDLIVLNSLQDAGAGFGHDTNKITLISKSNKILSFELKSKAAVAVDIVNTIVEELGA